MGQCCSKQKPRKEYFSITKPSKEDLLLPKPQDAALLTSQPQLDGAPVVTQLDLCIARNAVDHKTVRYDLSTKRKALVIRRGQEFQIFIRFNRKYDEDRDHISLIFTVDGVDVPSLGHGTLEAVPVTRDESNVVGSWSVQIVGNEGDKITLKVTPSSQAVVGKWKVDVDTKTGAQSLSYSHAELIYILFNAWCLADDVCLEDVGQLDEYVLNDAGLLYRGSHSRIRPCPWNFGQYEPEVLDCSIYILEKALCSRISERADSVAVMRAVSAMVNHCDEDGVLVGNWSKDYSGGTRPTKWQGSVKILQKYFKEKRPVKFGQCWVFAGIVTTVCRALGIPCRPVTNFSSAHDTHGSVTMDTFYDSEGAPVDRLNRDSVWNFHVWNEGWSKRPDLGPKYDGWQAFDATPQEVSEGRYACGPSSLVAIKEGEIKRPFDTSFVFAEVNADSVYWKYSGPMQPLKLLLTDTSDIGKAVVTKKTGEWDLEDVTEAYKDTESSDTERRTMVRALREAGHIFSRYYLNEELEDVKFDFQLNDDITIGETFHVVLKVENRNKESSYLISAYLRVDSQLYTGRIGHFVKKNTYKFRVGPGQVDEVSMPVTYEEYYKHLVDQCAFNVAALASVVDTDFEYFANDDFRVRKPDIQFELDGHPSEGAELKVNVDFLNPLPISLTSCRFLLEGGGLTPPIKIKLGRPVNPFAPARGSVTIMPSSAGEHMLAAKFYSKQLTDVDGFLQVSVKPRLEHTGAASDNLL